VKLNNYELKNLWAIMEQLLSVENFISNVLVIHNPRGRNDDKFFGTSHEYMLVFSNNKQLSEIKNFQITEADVAQYNKEDEISKYALTGYMRTGNNSSKHERPNLHYPIYLNEEDIELSLEKKEGWIQLLPINGAGEEKTWRWGKDTFLEKWKTEILISNSRGEWKLQKKRRMTGEGKKPKTIWHNSRYDASTNGIMLMKAMFGSTNVFSYPKSLYTVEDAISISSNDNDIILDYFAGSATTAHAVINLNRERGSSRKYINIEVGTYFNSATKPRVLKSIYSDTWKNGSPIGRNGSSHIFKYHDLESYEDVLNNLILNKDEKQSSLLKGEAFKEEYMLSYMLDLETKHSLLNIDAFKNPFNYKLNITRNNESQETVIDLVETFNYLIGLHVKTMQTIKGFKVITGVTNERDEEILVIWRNTEEKSNKDLNEFFSKMNFSTRDTEFQRIYVNGDNHLENLKIGDEKWKVVLIEEEFTKRMFDVQDV
jgi:adenine-specific DNA-methyltransferase